MLVLPAGFLSAGDFMGSQNWKTFWYFGLFYMLLCFPLWMQPQDRACWQRFWSAPSLLCGDRCCASGTLTVFPHLLGSFVFWMNMRCTCRASRALRRAHASVAPPHSLWAAKKEMLRTMALLCGVQSSCRIYGIFIWTRRVEVLVLFSSFF